MTINRFIQISLALILVLAAVMYGIHAIIAKAYYIKPLIPLRLFNTIYVFLVPLSLLSIWFVAWRFKQDNTAAGRAFFVVIFMKIFASAIFLYPGVVTVEVLAKKTAMHFMPVFFILLFIETFLLVKLLNQPFSEK